VPFKIVVRDNLKQTADDFSSGQVYHFEDTPVTVGKSSDCSCSLPAVEDIADHHFEIVEPEEGKYTLRPEAGETVYVNREPIAKERRLASGDEIRVGHYTFRFQREHRYTKAGRRADLFAISAKVIIVCLLAIEVFFVYWLPQQIQSKEMLASGIIKQQTVLLLDEARENSTWDSAEYALQKKYALQLLQEELDSIARYIRQNEKSIPEAQWQRFYSTIKKLNTAAHKIHTQNIFRPLPQPQLKRGVRSTINKYENKPLTNDR